MDTTDIMDWVRLLKTFPIESMVLSPTAVTVMLKVIEIGSLRTLDGTPDYNSSTVVVFNFNPANTITNTRVYVENGRPLNELMVRQLKEIGVDVVVGIDYNAINEWASECTHGQLERIVNSTVENKSALLISAMYMRTEWQWPFNKENTRKRPFTKINKDVVNVDMMRETVSCTTGKVDEVDCMILNFNGTWTFTILGTLNLCIDNRYFFVMMPVDMRDFVAQLTVGRIQTYANACTCSEGSMTVFLPTFVTETRVKNLGDRLNLFAIPFRIFDNSVVELDAMIQHTKFDVSENADAACVTTSLQCDDDCDKLFNANHPFMFGVVKNSVFECVGIYNGE